MNIYVNNQLKEVQIQTTITTTLNMLNISAQKGIAIAVNNEVVPKSNWDKHELCDNDKITLIQATQGG